MKKILLYLLLLGITHGALGQQQLNFRQVDSSSYAAYLNADWDKVIQIGKQAISGSNDYFYLRMRIGYSYFMTKDYRKAIPHFRQALVFNNQDKTALHYLYLCYLFSGRKDDASTIENRLRENKENTRNKLTSRLIPEIAFFTTYGTGSSDAMKAKVLAGAPDIIEGAQTLSNSFQNFYISLENRLLPWLRVNNSANLLYKNEWVWSVVNGNTYLSEEQVVRQINYRLELNATLSQGLTISPFFSTINYRIPVFYEYGAGLGKNRDVYRYNTSSETAYGLQSIKQHGKFRFATAYTHSKLNLCTQDLGGISVTFFPKGNLNLYFIGKSYLLHQQDEMESENTFIFSQETGVRVMDKLWLETILIGGGFMNFYDPFSGIAYNSLEHYNLIAGINFIVPIEKTGISFFLNYRNYYSSSIYVPATESLNSINSITYIYHTISGGISWKPLKKS